MPDLTWQQHVRQTRAKYGCSFKEALTLGSQTYRGNASTRPSNYRSNRVTIATCVEKTDRLLEENASKARSKKELKSCVQLISLLNKHTRREHLNRTERRNLQTLIHNMSILILDPQSVKREDGETDSAYIKRLEAEYKEYFPRGAKAGAGIVAALALGTAYYYYPEMFKEASAKVGDMFSKAQQWFKDTFTTATESK